MHISLDSALGQQRRLNSVGESITQIAPDPTAAYSLRSLTGGDPKVVRVRRPNNDERDFTASEINSGEMLSWVTESFFANDGFVQTWYDQSGNGKDATQSTANNQPKIVEGGSLVSNGLNFDGSNDHIPIPSSIISNINSFSGFIVCKGRSGFALDTALSISKGTGTIIRLGNYLFGSTTNSYAGSTTSLGTSDDSKHLISLIVGDSSAESFLDGTSKGTISTASGYDADGNIGADTGSGNFWQGQIEEVIIYASNQDANRVALETNIQTAYPTLP